MHAGEKKKKKITSAKPLKFRDHEEQWDATRFKLESKNKEQDSENQRLQLQIVTFDNERTVGSYF